MNEKMRLFAVGLLALGLTSTYGLSAMAQDLDEDGYVIEERYDDDDPAPLEDRAPLAELDDDDDTVVIAQQDGMQRCAERFRSFDASSGTYTTYQGETRTCPYLE